jgi:hypothetical protein
MGKAWFYETGLLLIGKWWGLRGSGAGEGCWREGWSVCVWRGGGGRECGGFAGHLVDAELAGTLNMRQGS